VSEAADAPIPYQVVYTGRVRAALRKMVIEAQSTDQRSVLVAAVRELDRLLHLYPQFGEPLMDLKHEGGQIWHGMVGPMMVRYAIYEDRRLVMVAIPPILLGPKAAE
jgi:hypothetical protein